MPTWQCLPGRVEGGEGWGSGGGGGGGGGIGGGGVVSVSWAVAKHVRTPGADFSRFRSRVVTVRNFWLRHSHICSFPFLTGSPSRSSPPPPPAPFFPYFGCYFSITGERSKKILK